MSNKWSDNTAFPVATSPLGTSDSGVGLQGGANKKWRAGASPDIINVFEFMTAVQQADVRAQTGGQDVTAAVTAALAAIPSTGAEVWFPAGRYKTTGGFTISNPFLLRGSGAPKYDGSAGVSWIECNSTTAKLFTVSAHSGRFETIGLVQTGGTATSGSSAVLVDSATLDMRIDFEELYTSGFYDAVDVKVGESWGMHACKIYRAVHWGVRVRNTVNVDAGDWSIADCNIYPASGGAAGVRVESSGGGKITGNKIIPNSGNIVSGIDVDFTGNLTEQLLIIGNDIEHTTAQCIKLKALPYIVCNDNLLKSIDSGGLACIDANICQTLTISGNTFIGAGTGPGVSLTTCNNAAIVGNNNYSVTTPVTGSISNDVIDLQGVSFIVSGLPSAANVAPGTRAYVTDATATTFLSTVAGGGANKVPVLSNGTNWVIG